MIDYYCLFERITECYPDQIDRERELLKNGLLLFAPYVSNKTGQIMKAMQLLQKQRNEAIYSCMCEVRNLCDELMIPYAFLKGLCLAVQVYDFPESRVFDDIDILVSEENYKALLQKCLDVGFSFGEGVDALVCSPYKRINNGHLHGEVLYKSYEYKNRTLKIPLEIHVSPIEGCFEMYGKVLETNGYTEQLLSRTRAVTIQTELNTTECFMVPSIDDSVYTQIMHMITHMTIDPVLYLFFDKPWKHQSVIKQLLDIYLFDMKNKPDWHAVQRLAEEHVHLLEYSCAISVLNQFWGISVPLYLQNSGKEVYNRPIDFVCDKFQDIKPGILVGNTELLKKTIDEIICQWIRYRNNSIPDGFCVVLNHNEVLVTLDEEKLGNGMYAITVYCITEENNWVILDYVLETAASKWLAYQGNGFQMIWDPNTYGLNSENDILTNCYRLFAQKPYYEPVRIDLSFTGNNSYCNNCDSRILITRINTSYISRFAST